MKKVSVFLILLLISTVCFAQVEWRITSQNVSNPSRLRRLLQSRFDNVEDDVGSLLALNQKGTGNFYYVDSGRSNAASIDGKSWTKAEPTWDDAVNNCTDNNGDYIFIAQGHAENFAAADAVDLDVIGVTTIFLGNGTNQGTLTYTGTAGEVVVGAANNKVIGGRYLAGISEVVHAFEIEADADNFTLYGGFFPEPSGSSSYEFDKVIDPASGADSISILNCTGHSADNTGMSSFIDLDTGVNNDVLIANNTFIAECSSALIFSRQADKEVILENNRLTNLTSAKYCIQFEGDTTGMATNNKLQTNARGTAFDPGAMYVDQTNTWLDTDSTNNECAIPVFNTGELLCIEKVDGAVTGGDDNLFAISGGPIMVEEFVGVVTTGIGATAFKGAIQEAVTTPSGDVHLSTEVTMTSDAAGTTYTYTAAAPGVLTPTTAGALANVPAFKWLCPIGTIQFSSSAANSTGVIKWYMAYKPLSPNSVVEASP